MGAKKRDHYNPILLLKHFANADGLIYVFDKRQPHRLVQPLGPKSVFVHKHLYSEFMPDGTRRRELDDFYTALEALADPIVNKITMAARAGRLPGLSAEEKSIWDLFLYNQWRRVPDSYERFSFNESDVKTLLAEYERQYHPLTDEQRTHWSAPRTLARLRQNVHVDALKRQSLNVLHILGGRGLGIGVISKPNKSFITSSFPVVKLTNPETPQLDHPTTEAWIAIAPDVAVTPAGERGEERVVEVSDDHHVRGLNRALFQQSTSIAGRSRELVASLAGIK